jgi:hypothetical protein
MKNSIGLDYIEMKMQIVIKLKARRKKSIYDRIESKKIVKQILFISKTKICDKIRIVKEIEFMVALGLGRNQKQKENRSSFVNEIEVSDKIVRKDS